MHFMHLFQEKGSRLRTKTIPKRVWNPDALSCSSGKCCGKNFGLFNCRGHKLLHIKFGSLMWVLGREFIESSRETEEKKALALECPPSPKGAPPSELKNSRKSNQNTPSHLWMTAVQECFEMYPYISELLFYNFFGIKEEKKSLFWSNGRTTEHEGIVPFGKMVVEWEEEEERGFGPEEGEEEEEEEEPPAEEGRDISLGGLGPEVAEEEEEKEKEEEEKGKEPPEEEGEEEEKEEAPVKKKQKKAESRPQRLRAPSKTFIESVANQR